MTMNAQGAIVRIVSEPGGFVSALGHRVALHLGGEPELKRRVLGTLAQLDSPPDEIRFERVAGDEVAEAAAEEEPTQPSAGVAAPPAAAELAVPPAEPPPRKGGRSPGRR